MKLFLCFLTFLSFTLSSFADHQPVSPIPPSPRPSRPAPQERFPSGCGVSYVLHIRSTPNPRITDVIMADGRIFHVDMNLLHARLFIRMAEFSRDHTYSIYVDGNAGRFMRNMGMDCSVALLSNEPAPGATSPPNEIESISINERGTIHYNRADGTDGDIPCTDPQASEASLTVFIDSFLRNLRNQNPAQSENSDSPGETNFQAPDEASDAAEAA